MDALVWEPVTHSDVRSGCVQSEETPRKYACEQAIENVAALKEGMLRFSTERSEEESTVSDVEGTYSHTYIPTLTHPRSGRGCLLGVLTSGWHGLQIFMRSRLRVASVRTVCSLAS